MVPDLTNEKGF
jgi:hypothetical protein